MIKNISPNEAEFLKMLQEEPELVNALNFIRKNGLNEIIRLANRLTNIAPIGSEDKVEYLSDLLQYVEAMIHGDDISKLYSNITLGTYAQTALSKLIQGSHKQELDTYQKAKNDLLEGISQLQARQQELLAQNSECETINADLQGKVSELSEKWSDLQKQIDEGKDRIRQILEDEKSLESIISSGKDSIDKELAEYREQSTKNLDREIQAKRAELAELEAKNEEAKQTLLDFKGKLANVISGQSSKIVVTWQAIHEDDPIYNTNSLTIEAYINSLKSEYIEKMHCSEQECDRIFEQKCPGLKEFIKIVKKFSSTNETASSVRTIISCTWSGYAQYLENLLKIFKFPKYIEKGLDSLVDFQPQGISGNLQQMLENFYWQKKAAEAIAAQKIAEAELLAVVSIFKGAISPDYDFSISDQARSAITNREIAKFLEGVQAQLEEASKNSTVETPSIGVGNLGDEENEH